MDTKKQARKFQEVTSEEAGKAHWQFVDYLTANIGEDAARLFSCLTLITFVKNGEVDSHYRADVTKARHDFAKIINDQTTNPAAGQIRKELHDLSESDLQDLLAVIRFLAWRGSGKPKTDEVKSGERLYFWAKAHDKALVTG